MNIDDIPVKEETLTRIHNLDKRIKKVIKDTVVGRALTKAMETPAVHNVDEILAVPPEAEEVVKQDQVFQLFAIYSGDVEKTALASGWTAVQVEAAAAQHAWRNKIKVLIDLKQSNRPGDSERGINRAINFVQAHQYRCFLNRVLLRLGSLNREELEDYILGTEVDNKTGRISRKLNTRAFADLSSAIEKCHAMTYQALADTVGDRKGRDEEPDTGKSAAELSLAITKAMQEVRDQARKTDS